MSDGKSAFIKEVIGNVRVPYHWSYGTSLSRFFEETKLNKKIYGARCSKCKKVIIPPTTFCGRCYAETEKEWVLLSDKGSIFSWTTVFLPFPGQPTEPPYTYGLIKLDGADTHWAHLISGIDPDKLQPEMRVEAVWNENRKGDMFDIKYFKPIA